MNFIRVCFEGQQRKYFSIKLQRIIYSLKGQIVLANLFVLEGLLVLYKRSACVNSFTLGAKTHWSIMANEA